MSGVEELRLFVAGRLGSGGGGEQLVDNGLEQVESGVRRTEEQHEDVGVVVAGHEAVVEQAAIVGDQRGARRRQCRRVAAKKRQAIGSGSDGRLTHDQETRQVGEADAHRAAERLIDRHQVLLHEPVVATAERVKTAAVAGAGGGGVLSGGRVGQLDGDGGGGEALMEVLLRHVDEAHRAVLIGGHQVGSV